jgi:hypothetical protein
MRREWAEREDRVVRNGSQRESRRVDGRVQKTRRAGTERGRTRNGETAEGAERPSEIWTKPKNEALNVVRACHVQFDPNVCSAARRMSE